MKRLLFLLLMISSVAIFAQKDENHSVKELTHWMSPEEMLHKEEIGKNRVITNPPAAPIINIAEFQPSQGVIVRYPFGIPTSLVAQMSQVVMVTTIVNSASQQNNVISQYQSAGVNMDNVDFLIATTDSYWTRDYGPWFIIDGNDEFGVVDFVYNRPRPNDDAFAPLIANHLEINLFGMDMEHTGGNYMTDGYGISASTTLTITENNMTAQQLQTMASDYLGINTYHFIDDPLDDYIEHIDCWGKFLAVDKVLIAQVPETDYRYQDYEDVANFFANTPTSWGYNYKVFRVFTPGGTYDHTTPYTNSLILNDHVFVPQTGNEWDDEAIASYQTAMPGYTIVPMMQGIAGWENTDALHCRTHEIADLGMLLIRHYPIYGEQMANIDYVINAEITAYSGQTLISDSVMVYYRVNDGDWQSVSMLPQCGKTWRATISNVPEGGEVDYYIFAKDASGRREKHPYIGEADPHTFTVSSFDCPTPTDLQATASDNKIILNWTAVEGATSYSIYRNNLFVTASTNTTWNDVNVEGNVEYCYQIAAVCISGTSNFSNTACATLTSDNCEIPTNVTTTVEESAIQLSWDAAVNALNYKIFRNETLLTVVSSNTYEDAAVSSNVEYCYKVKTVCANTESDFSEQSCAIVMPCEVVSQLSGTLINDNTEVLLTWTPVENALSYNVYKNGSLYQSEITNTIFSEDYVSNAAWCYSLATVCENGSSELSEETCIDPTQIAIDEWNQNINIYPNPAHKNITIETKQNIQKIVLYNTLGKVVYNAENVGQRINISVSELPQGIYMIQLMNNDSVITEKIVVR